MTILLSRYKRNKNKLNIERSKMTKIRMNTELRNKLFNKIKNVFENEDTQEKEAFLQAREEVDVQYLSLIHISEPTRPY